MKTSVVFLCALLTAGLLGGCDRARRMSKGFVFPVGDTGRGQKAFVDLRCYDCHRVDGVPELPVPSASPEKVVTLGGKVAKLRTYGDLVTAIIHPRLELSDKLANRGVFAESPMPVVNEQMTVTQMLDLVTFLEPRYKELEPIYHYPGL